MKTVFAVFCFSVLTVAADSADVYDDLVSIAEKVRVEAREAEAAKVVFLAAEVTRQAAQKAAADAGNVLDMAGRLVRLQTLQAQLLEAINRNDWVEVIRLADEIKRQTESMQAAQAALDKARGELQRATDSSREADATFQRQDRERIDMVETLIKHAQTLN